MSVVTTKSGQYGTKHCIISHPATSYCRLLPVSTSNEVSARILFPKEFLHIGLDKR